MFRCFISLEKGKPTFSFCRANVRRYYCVTAKATWTNSVSKIRPFLHLRYVFAFKYIWKALSSSLHSRQSLIPLANSV